GSVLIGTVWLCRAIPETPGLPLGCGAQKILEITRVIVVADPPSGRRGRAPVERLACHLARLALGVVGHTRPPALAGHTDEVTLSAQRLGVGLELRGEKADVITRILQLPRVSPSQQAGARRRALGVGGVGAGEQEALAGNAVESRGRRPAAAVRS